MSQGSRSSVRDRLLRCAAAAITAAAVIVIISPAVSAQPFTVAQIHAFSSAAALAGSQPGASLIQASDGNFYGTTTTGGSSTNCTGGCGTVFKITNPLGPN